MSLRLGEDQFRISDPKQTVERIKRFLETQRDRTKTSVFIVGMSGGLDSSLTAALCALSVGGKHVLGVSLPEKETRNEANIRDTKIVAKKFGIKLRVIEISGLVAAASNTLPEMPGNPARISFGNLKARLRAAVLYYFANQKNGLVVGTSDKSEVMLGYFTKFGDGASDIEPIADLYKTSVKELAKYLRLPSSVYSKPPSPDLWPGQTAKKELGLDYEKLDTILLGLEHWIGPEDIAEQTGISLNLVKRVRDRWIGSEHKRRPPLALKLGYRTSGADLRLPYSIV
jgi:NAD+ synthase